MLLVCQFLFYVAGHRRETIYIGPEDRALSKDTLLEVLRIECVLTHGNVVDLVEEQEVLRLRYVQISGESIFYLGPQFLILLLRSVELLLGV